MRAYGSGFLDTVSMTLGDRQHSGYTDGAPAVTLVGDEQSFRKLYIVAKMGVCRR